MEQYNWKNHYAAQLRELGDSDTFSHYSIEESGSGEIISCTVFQGIQAVYNELNLFHCGRSVPKTEEVVEINYCAEGQYECEVNSRYCFYAMPGDLSVGYVGRREAAGSFPTGRFSGLTLFIEPASVGKQNDFLLNDLKVDFDVIRQMSAQKPRRFYIRDRKEVDTVCRQMISAVKTHDLSLLKLKTLELLMLLSDRELLQSNYMPVYLNQKNVQLAKNVRQIITGDLSRHVTLKQLSEKLDSSPTSIKRAFKNVYGEPIREHLKSIRLQEAQRLLRDTDLPIAEVAETVGYANPGHFSVAFHRKFTVTPSEYRKLARSGR